MSAAAGTVPGMLTLTRHEPGDLVVLGMDGEMSGEPEEGGALIQAGFAAVTGEGTQVFNSVLNPGPMQWVERAAQVHGLSRDVVEQASAAAVVDDLASDWLRRHGGVDGLRQVVTVGFNVGAWDHPFFRAALPRTMAMVSRRTIDLNALCFTLDGWDPNPRAAAAARDWAGWKRSAKAYAAKTLAREGFTVAEHDAGYDAAEALHAWLFLRDQVHTARTRGRHDAVDGQDPALVAALGAGLLRRLEPVPVEVVRTLVDRLPAGQKAGKWLGSKRVELGGRTGLQALLDGDADTVLALLR